MRIIRNKFLPFNPYIAINLFGILFCKENAIISGDLMRHEMIHTAQIKELLVIGFYIWYFLEWLIRIPMKGNAYRNISFEREAYAHMDEPDYLKERKPFAWWKYLKNQKT